MAAAAASDYPSRPIRLVTAVGAGTGGDGVARLIGGGLSQILRQSIVIDNRPGADGNIAAAIVAGANPDGYTLLFDYTAHVITPSLHTSLPFDPIRDFTPVSMLVTNSTALVVRKDHSAKSVADLVALARKKPGGLSIGIVKGSVTHMAAELLFSETGLDVRRVPYETNPAAMADVLGGRIDFAFSTVGPIRTQLQAGSLRALAVTESKRSESLPDAPTMAETLPKFSVTGWYGLVGPKSLPVEIVATLNKALRQVLSNPEIRSKLVQRGSQPSPTSPQQFGAFIAAEIQRWRKIIKKADFKSS